LKGHFLLSSGLHSPQYMQSALVLSEPARAELLGAALAARLKEKVDLVVAPAMGGLIIGHEVARALKVRSYFTERENGIMTLRRGFKLEPRERVVVVEDVITTGKSTGEVNTLLKSLGAEPVAALSIVDRSEKPLSLGIPVASLIKLSIPSYEASACPLCKEGRPVVKPGSRTQPQ
jgi:orotate phosphoribosyltransferase